MGNRLSKIYTRTGDKGTTGLGDGTRIEKDALRVEAFGTVDELNSMLGLLVCKLNSDEQQELRETLVDIQHALFDLGGELCIPGHALIMDNDIEQLERHLDQFNEYLAPLKDFILPGGSEAAATCHLARTICRRAERRVVSLSASESIRPQVMGYLNRLSDLLFVAARKISHDAGEAEHLWQKTRRQRASGNSE